ncbi:hypothetical protein N2152v2_004130 [Parachlorella kessleri]
MKLTLLTLSAELLAFHPRLGTSHTQEASTALSVTRDRQDLVNFVRPYYYSAGYYALDYIRRVYGAIPVLVKNGTEAAQKIAAGQAEVYVDDNTNLKPGGDLKLMGDIMPINEDPYGVAVANNNTQLYQKLSAAMKTLATGGLNAPLIKFENEVGSCRLDFCMAS